MKKVIKNGTRKVKPIDPPILTREEWLFTSVLGSLLILMALLQLVSFTDFRDTLKALGLSASSAWAAGIIFAELFGAAGFFKIRYSYFFRVFSGGLALLAAGFWFLVVAQALSTGRETVGSSALFGGFLNQKPGWWTIIEVTALLFLTVFAVALTRYTLLIPRRRK